jgi:hypothetical protein
MFLSLAGNLWSAGQGSVIPGLLPSQEFGELRLQDAEFVAPRVVRDPEVKAAFGLVIPAGGAEGFQSADFSFHVVGFQVEMNWAARFACCPAGPLFRVIAIRPARGGQPCPPAIAPIRLPIAGTARLASLAAHDTAGLITRARLAFTLRWSLRRRRHQATAPRHHYSARLLAATGTG